MAAHIARAGCGRLNLGMPEDTLRFGVPEVTRSYDQRSKMPRDSWEQSIFDHAYIPTPRYTYNI